MAVPGGIDDRMRAIPGRIGHKLLVSVLTVEDTDQLCVSSVMRTVTCLPVAVVQGELAPVNSNRASSSGRRVSCLKSLESVPGVEHVILQVRCRSHSRWLDVNRRSWIRRCCFR